MAVALNYSILRHMEYIRHIHMRSLTFDTHLLAQFQAAEVSLTVVQIALIQSLALLLFIFADCAHTISTCQSIRSCRSCMY